MRRYGKVQGGEGVDWGGWGDQCYFTEKALAEDESLRIFHSRGHHWDFRGLWHSGLVFALPSQRLSALRCRTLQHLSGEESPWLRPSQAQPCPSGGPPWARLWVEGRSGLGRAESLAISPPTSAIRAGPANSCTGHGARPPVLAQSLFSDTLSPLLDSRNIRGAKQSTHFRQKPPAALLLQFSSLT